MPTITRLNFTSLSRNTRFMPAISRLTLTSLSRNTRFMPAITRLTFASLSKSTRVRVAHTWMWNYSLTPVSRTQEWNPILIKPVIKEIMNNVPSSRTLSSPPIPHHHSGGIAIVLFLPLTINLGESSSYRSRTGLNQTSVLIRLC